MHTNKRTVENTSNNTPRRAWTTPTATYRGSVAELVQIAKASGTNDCFGHKRNGSGC